MLPRDVILRSVHRFAKEKCQAVSQAVSTDISCESQVDVAAGEVQCRPRDHVESWKGLSAEYVLRALNLLDPYALKVSGMTRNIRLFNGNIKNLNVFKETREGKIPIRKYNADEGAGAPNYMRTLFPSSSGGLSTAGGFGNVARFTADSNPTPEMIARIAAYFYKFRCADDKSSMKNELSNIEKTLSKVGKLSENELYARFYDIVCKHRDAVAAHDRLQRTSMTAEQYLDVVLADDLLKKKLIFLREHVDDAVCSAVKAKIKSEFQKTDEDIGDFIRTLTYDQIKGREAVIEALDMIDEETAERYLNLDEELLFKIKLIFLKNHLDDAESSVVQKKIKSEFHKTDEEMYGFMQSLGYEQVKDKKEVIGALEDMNTKAVLNDMRVNLDKYSPIRRELAIFLRDKGPKIKIAFDRFVASSKEFKVYKEAILAVEEEKAGKYKAVVDMVNDVELGDDIKSKVIAEAKVDRTLLECCMSKLERSAIDDVCGFFASINMGMDIKREDLYTYKGAKKARAILELLKEGTYMIQYQEADDDSGTGDKYPMYTTERMLMSYFMEYFNEASEVERFYDEIDRMTRAGERLVDDTVYRRLDVLSQVIQSIPINEEVPYVETHLIENGATKAISVPDDKSGKVSFFGNFSDCADTVVRHLFNILFYCRGKSWIDVLPSGVSKALEKEKEEVVEAINDSSKKVRFHSLRDRLKIFYAHQTVSNVNDGSVVMRSLWSYVTSNMGRALRESGLYAVKYLKEQRYELDTGYINMLKLMYNIEKALHEGDGKDDLLSCAHEAIETLVQTKKIVDLTEALEALIHIVRPDIDVDVKMDVGDGVKLEDDEFYGSLGVTLMSQNFKKDIRFTILQLFYHASVILEKGDNVPLIADLSGFESDPIIKLLVSSAFNSGAIEVIDDFYTQNAFAEVSKTDMAEKSTAFANSRLLKLICEIGGDESNSDRVYNLMKKYFYANADVTVDGKDLFEFFRNLFRRSVLLHFGVKITDLESIDDSSYESYNYIDRGDGVVEIYPTERLKNREEIEIPSGIGGSNKYIISAGAFIGFTRLKTMTFSKDITSVVIGDYAFCSSGINELRVLGNVKSFAMGVGVFHDANDFKVLNISDEVQHIELGKMKFKDNKLAEIKVAEGVESFSIPSYAFENIKLFDTVTISGSFKELSVSAHAFDMCSEMTLNICASVENVIFSSMAFFNSRVCALNLADGIQSLIIENGAFHGSEVRDIVIPSSVRHLRLSDYDRFQGSESKKFVVPINIESLVIGRSVFSAIEWKFENLVLGKLKCLTLTEDAFVGFKEKTFTIEWVEQLKLDTYVFYNSYIETLILKDVQTLIVQESAFVGSEMKKLDFGTSLQSLILNGCVFYTFEGTELTIPSGVKKLELGRDVFYSSDIEVLKFEGVTDLTIEDRTFLNGNVRKIDFGSGLERLTLSGNAFYDFKGEVLEVPASVMELQMNEVVFSHSEIKTLVVKCGLEDEDFVGEVFAESQVSKIVIYDEESRDLLASHRSDYGIGGNVKIELAADITA